MAKKALRKKKAYKLATRQKVQQGFVNNSDGTWIPINHSNSMHRDQVAGYKL